MAAETNRTPYTIFGCLTLRPMSGYDVKRFLDRTVVHFWSESYGQIYPTLERLDAWLAEPAAPVRSRYAELVQGWCDESEALLRSVEASP